MTDEFENNSSQRVGRFQKIGHKKKHKYANNNIAIISK